jgi:hypothetical protein
MTFNSASALFRHLPSKSLNSQKRKHELLRIMDENQVKFKVDAGQENQ